MSKTFSDIVWQTHSLGYYWSYKSLSSNTWNSSIFNGFVTSKKNCQIREHALVAKYANTKYTFLQSLAIGFSSICSWLQNQAFFSLFQKKKTSHFIKNELYCFEKRKKNMYMYLYIYVPIIKSYYFFFTGQYLPLYQKRLIWHAIDLVIKFLAVSHEYIL